MRNDKRQATEMRKSGKSYLEIEARLKIPRSTLSEWFRSESWSDEIRKKLSDSARVGHRVRLIGLSKIRGINLKKAYQQARIEAEKELSVLKYHPVFIAGLMLYWGEGDKITKNGVRITNTDPGILKIFVLFLEKICGVSREDIHASVLVYPDLDEFACRQYWSREIGLDIGNFRKSTLIKGRHTTKRLGYGVCIIYTSSAYLKTKLSEWLRLFLPELMKGEYYENI